METYMPLTKGMKEKLFHIELENGIRVYPISDNAMKLLSGNGEALGGYYYEMREPTMMEKVCDIMTDIVEDTTWTALAGLFVFACTFTAIALMVVCYA